MSVEEHNQLIMGDYEPYPDYPDLNYDSFPGPVKKYPVYYHTFNETREIGDPRRSFLYFYYNEDERITETDCPKGCWMIGK